MAVHPVDEERGGVAVAAMAPVPRPLGLELVRPRLLRRLQQATTVPVSIVLGPPGSGKSVAVAAWARSAPLDVAWVALGPHCEDGVVFWRSVAHGLGLDAATAPDGIAAAIRERVAIAPLVVVLDDVHLIGRDALDAIRALQREMHGGAHLVLTARTRPPGIEAGLALVDGELPFTDDEVGAVLDASPVAVDPPLRASVGALVQGWPAGLHLVVDALARGAPSDDVVTRPLSAMPDLAEYLRSEVLHACSPAELRLLLETSIIDELTVDSCLRLVQRPVDVSALLDALAARRLLVERVAAGRWRCHPLLRALLRAELERDHPKRAARAHRAAADLARAEGRRADAVEHLLRGGDHRTALRWSNGAAIEVIEDGDEARLRAWVTALAAVDDWTGDELVQVSVLARYAGDIHESATILRRAADRGARIRDLEIGRAHWRLRLGDMDEGLRHAAAAGLGADEPLPPDLVAMVVVAELCNDDLAGARARLHEWDPGPSAATWIETVVRPGLLALAAWWRGDLDEARQLAVRSLRNPMRNNRHPAMIPARFVRAALAAEAGVVSARRLLADVLTDVEAGGWQIFTVLTHIELARLRASEGRFDLAARELEQARSLGDPHPLSPSLGDRIDAADVQLHLLAGEVDQAAGIAERIRLDRLHSIAVARCCLASGAPETAIRIVRTVDRSTTRSRLVADLIEVAATVALHRDADPVARSVLDALTDNEYGTLVGNAGNVLGALQRAARTDLDRETVAAVRRRVELVSADALTARELAVLEYLPSRLSVQAIADELYLSLNTVKYHLKRIYRKLGVASREEAVARAIEMSGRDDVRRSNGASSISRDSRRP
jgi:LuxR family maltose regulon positive regulatory protein